MKAYYARSGEVIFICPNARVTIKKQNLVPYGYINCAHGASKHPQNPIIYDMKECVQLHAEFESLRASFKAITKSLTLAELRKATHGTLSDIQILKSANLALMLGLSENQLCELFESGLKLGYALGATSEYAIRSLSKGISRQSRLILDNIGISFRASTANQYYAQAHDLKKLSAEQKREAWRSYAIKLVIEKAKVLDVPSELARRDQLKAKLENQKTEFGKEGL
jgi:hypothetical protein